MSSVEELYIPEPLSKFHLVAVHKIDFSSNCGVR